MLTGQLRNRKSWFGKIILQVEIKHGFTERLTHKTSYRWRDATVEDLVWLSAHNMIPDAMLPGSMKSHRPIITPEYPPSPRPSGFTPRIVK
jgi:hypothetical protein